MVNAGFTTYKKKRITKENFVLGKIGNMSYEITPTEKMNEFIHKKKKSSIEVIVGQIEFDEVTGIIDVNENTKKKEYSTKPIFNEISKFFKIHESERKPSVRSAYFQKYDDGWRMK